MHHDPRPPTVDVTDEMESTGLNERLAFEASQETLLNIPADRIRFQLRWVPHKTYRLLMSAQGKSATGEPTETDLIARDVDLKEGFIGDIKMTDEEIIQLRAALKTLPPTNRVLRMIWQVGQWMEKRNLRAEFAEKLSVRLFARIVEEGRSRIQQALLSGAIPPVWAATVGGKDSEAKLVSMEVIAPWSVKLHLNEDEDRALRERVIQKLGLNTPPSEIAIVS